MKTNISITALAITILMVLQSFTIMSANRTEQQQYTVVLTEKNFEIRFYPSATLATVNSNAKSYRDLANPGFRRLAGYIFGGNETSKKIAMTAPVHMDINGSGSSMSFVMPSSYNTENLPKPNDPGVIIHQTDDEYVAVIRFGGYASDKDIKKYSGRLQDMLEEKGITAQGNARFLGYNPPYQFFGRRNEIVIPVNWNAE
jgi:hypothetical protein